MTAAALLEIFRLINHDELYARPRTPTVVSLVLQLPTDSGAYTEVAEEAFGVFLLNRDEPDVQSFQRLADIFAILLYDDGRTFLACLRTAQLSNDHPAYGIYGVNSLAALANYMRRGRPIPIDRDTLLAKLQQLERNPDLEHNAAECAKILRVAYQ